MLGVVWAVSGLLDMLEVLNQQRGWQNSPWSAFQSFRALMVKVFQDGTGTASMTQHAWCRVVWAVSGLLDMLEVLNQQRGWQSSPWSVFQSFRALMVKVFQDGTDAASMTQHAWYRVVWAVSGLLDMLEVLNQQRGWQNSPWSVFQSFRALMVKVFQDGTDAASMTQHAWHRVVWAVSGLLDMLEVLNQQRGWQNSPWSVFQSLRALMVKVFQDGTDTASMMQMQHAWCGFGCKWFAWHAGSVESADRMTKLTLVRVPELSGLDGKSVSRRDWHSFYDAACLA